MKIMVICDNASVPNAAVIEEHLNLLGHESLFSIIENDSRGYWNKVKNISPNATIDFDADQFWIFGTRILSISNLLTLDLPIEKVKLVILDQPFRKNCIEMNRFIKLWKPKVYIMPDMLPFLDSTIPYTLWHIPVDTPITTSNKYEKLTICHSPHNLKKLPTKGTDQISHTVTKLQHKYDLDYRLVMYRTWDECMGIKARSQIFIDQVIKLDDGYIGGLGKSGGEGMRLRCAVMSSGDPLSSPYYPPPPVVWVTPDNFKVELVRLIDDKVYRDEVVNKQYKWAIKYLSSTFMVNLLVGE